MLVFLVYVKRNAGCLDRETVCLKWAIFFCTRRLMGHLSKKKKIRFRWSVHFEMVPEPIVLFAGSWIGCLWQIDGLCVVVCQAVVFACYFQTRKKKELSKEW